MIRFEETRWKRAVTRLDFTEFQENIRVHTIALVGLSRGSPERTVTVKLYFKATVLRQG